MKTTNDLISTKEAIERKMQVVKTVDTSSLFAIPEGRTDMYIQDKDRCFRKITKRYKRFPKSNCIIVCVPGEIYK